MLVCNALRLLAVWLLTTVSAEIFLYNKTVLQAATSLSPRCIDSMVSGIAYDPDLLRFATAGYVGSIPSDFLSKTLCSSECVSDLAAYLRQVKSECSTVDAWPGVPASYNGDFVQAYQNQTCLKDPSSGLWCSNFFKNCTQLNQGQQLEDLPKAELCSSCTIAFLRHSQASSFSNYDEKMAKSWKNIQKLCSLDPSETSVPRPAISHDLVPLTGGLGLNVTVRIQDYKPKHCHSQQTYTVVDGDSCRSISDRFSVATGTLEILNNLYADCSNLESGMEFCLPRTCKTYRVKDGDTCTSIRRAHKLGFGSLINYNPTMNRKCSNLVKDDLLCLSPPGGYPELRTVPEKTDSGA